MREVIRIIGLILCAVLALAGAFLHGKPTKYNGPTMALEAALFAAILIFV